MRSGATLLALNQSDVPNNCALAIVATGKARGNDIVILIAVEGVRGKETVDASTLPVNN
jgi:hypothetical protein